VAPTATEDQASTVRERYELADLEALKEAFVRLAEDVSPSVVAIQTYQVYDPARDNKGAPGRLLRIPASRGSGFVIDCDGYIATNSHVLDDSDIIEVRLYNGTPATSSPSVGGTSPKCK
jgi:serine protease Do